MLNYVQPSIFIMLIACRHSIQNNMNILILLVITMFVITAGYVGYHASQNQPVKETKGHGMEFETLDVEESIQTLQSLRLDKSYA